MQVLPLSQLPDGVQTALAVELMVEWLVHGGTGPWGNVCLDVRQQPPPSVDPLDPEGIIV